MREANEETEWLNRIYSDGDNSVDFHVFARPYYHYFLSGISFEKRRSSERNMEHRQRANPRS